MCLRLFAARGQNIIARRLLLQVLPNGDWRQKRVEVYVPLGFHITKEQAETEVCDGLVTALAGHMFELYPRSRWTGADISIDRCGLLECVHQLGSGSYMRFLESLGEGKGGTKDGDADFAHEALADQDLEHVDAGNMADEGDEATRQEQEAEESKKTPQANSKHRQLASRWWQTKPLGNLITMRLIMEPLRLLMSRHLELCGEEWDLKQRLSATGQAREGVPMRRKHRAVVAASLELEEHTPIADRTSLRQQRPMGRSA